MTHRLPLVLLLVVFMGGATLFATRDHWWFRVPLNAASVGGSPVEVTLWRSSRGMFLVDTRRYMYVVDPETQFVGVPNGSELTSFYLLAVTKHGQPLCVQIPSAKIPYEPRLAFQKGQLSFNGADGARIELRY